MEILGYLRVEGVNIYANLADTDQLSVIRGGSLILKDAIERIEARYSKALKPISTGASEGIFQVLKSDEGNLQQIESSVTSFLNDSSPFRYLTFTVVTLAYDDSQSFQDIKKRLVMKSRFRQLQQLTTPYDQFDSRKNSWVPCDIEGIRPASGLPNKYCARPLGDDQKANENVSVSVGARLKYGIDNRKALYQSELKKLAESEGVVNTLQADVITSLSERLDFTTDLQTLAGLKHMDNLHNKMAVVYFDGNGFGGIQADVVKDIESQAQFDNKVQTYRREFLYHWLNQMALSESEKSKERERYAVLSPPPQPDKKNGKAASEDTKGPATSSSNEESPVPRLRIETLLWGGDEMIFVVPAWLGLQLVHEFYACSQDWRYNDKHRFTHAGGIVFCNVKTPVFRIRQLAEALADHIKDNHPNGRKENLFNYMTLESIDYPTESLDTFLSTLYLPEVAASRTVLQPHTSSDWSDLVTKITHLKAHMPKSQLYKMVMAVMLTLKEHRHLESAEAKEDAVRKAFAAQMQRLDTLLGEQLAEVQSTLKVLFGTDGSLPKSENSAVQQDESEQARDGEQINRAATEEQTVTPAAENNTSAPVDKQSSDPKEAEKRLTELLQAFWPWLHLTELWDYLPESDDQASVHDEQTRDGAEGVAV